jgi:hypothetical protein
MAKVDPALHANLGAPAREEGRGSAKRVGQSELEAPLVSLKYEQPPDALRREARADLGLREQ